MNRDRAENSLLDGLPRGIYERLRPQLEPVTLKFGDVLYHPGAAIRQVYFPTGSVVSLLALVGGHLALEVGMVGREGMLGIPLALGVGVSPARARVQGSGTALRMKSAHFVRELERSAPLQRAVHRYIHDRLVQITQTAACNRFHHVEARLARWLLMTRDRMRSSQFRITQEMLAGMLGVLRVAVTNAAGKLQKRDLIRYSRGQVEVLDARALEAVACLCYQQIVEVAPPAR